MSAPRDGAGTKSGRCPVGRGVAAGRRAWVAGRV